jgi:hypothetical protein
MLALTGFVLFYAVAMLLTAIRIDGEGTERAQAIACLTAFIAHLVGIGIAFAAPRGRRLAPALLNALSLASMVGLMAYAVTRAH